MQDVFYLHEDEWDMAAVVPAENMARTQQIAQEAEQSGQEHFDGTGWTQMYVIPEEEHPISERGIKLQELRDLIGARLPEAAMVTSGYSTYREDVEKGFAFGWAYEHRGAFYGWSEARVIISLNLILPNSEDSTTIDLFTQVLSKLGPKYSLIVADWWRNKVVSLEDTEALRKYLVNHEA